MGIIPPRSGIAKRTGDWIIGFLIIHMEVFAWTALGGFLVLFVYFAMVRK